MGVLGTSIHISEIMSTQQETDKDQEVIEVPETEVEQEGVAGVVEAEEFIQEVKSLANSLEIEDFTAPRSELNHGHDIDKHDVRSRFNVSEELVSQLFMYAPNDHAALHELLARKEEFIHADTPVFTDTEDTDDSRWEKIGKAAGKAPIPDKVHRELQRR